MTATSIIVQALKTNPGATYQALAEATGIPPRTTQRAMDNLRMANRIVVVRFGRINHYFADEAQRDAHIDALTAKVKAEQAAAKELTKQKDAVRNLDRYHRVKVLSGEARGPKPKPAIPVTHRSVNKPQAGGPARLKGEPQITAATKFTIAPPPPDRLYRTTTHSVMP